MAKTFEQLMAEKQRQIDGLKLQLQQKLGQTGRAERVGAGAGMIGKRVGLGITPETFETEQQREIREQVQAPTDEIATGSPALKAAIQQREAQAEAEKPSLLGELGRTVGGGIKAIGESGLFAGRQIGRALQAGLLGDVPAAPFGPSSNAPRDA